MSGTPAPEPVASPGSLPAGASPKYPERLGDWHILGRLGAGGMGTVYRARLDPASSRPGLPPGAEVALKVVHAHLLGTPTFLVRFEREADLGRRIAHPNVVRTFGTERIRHEGRDLHVLTMERVTGQTIRALLDELGQVPEELCRHVGREVARGLVAVHAAGVIHRDLKPENVMLTGEHDVKIMDLGVARLAAELVRLSTQGQFVGSIHYAAPEAFRGPDYVIDARVDLYALGVLLYEMGTGVHPHRHDDVTVFLRRVLEETPRRAGEVNPQLSPLFEELVHTLLAKDPDRRLPSAASVVEVLERGEGSAWWRERARALRRETRRPLRRIALPRETALHGREEELARGSAVYEAAKRGEGRVLLVEGEAGIGKTRFVDELVARLQERGEDVNFLHGSYPPGGAATAAGAFSTAYREQFGVEGLEDTLSAYLPRSLPLVPAFAAVLRGEPPPAGQQPLTKESLQTVFVHATRALAAERPTVVLVDDLHFAPEEGLALFASLALAAPGHRVLLVGTTRPGLPAEWVAGLERQAHATRMVLGRLGPKDLAALLVDALRSERLAHELGMRIAEKSDGNPFFAFEIIRGLKEGKFITRRPDGSYVSAGPIRDITIPSSVLNLVNARVAELGEPDRELLDVAACCGFEFDAEVVAGVVGQPALAVLRRLAHLERRHRLVRASGRRFVFDHHQVQEALYASLPEMLREGYHRAIAESLERAPRDGAGTGGPADGPLAVDVCEHALRGRDAERARRHVEPALTHLEKGYLHAAAIRLSRGALAMPGLLTGRARAEMLLRLYARLDFLGRRQEQGEVLREAEGLADAEGDPGLSGRVARSLGNLNLRLGRPAEARAHHERALALFRRAHDRTGEAATLGNLGSLAYGEGRLADARALQESRLALAREQGDRNSAANAIGALANVAFALGRDDEAVRLNLEAAALSREAGDLRSEADFIANLGLALRALGRLAETKEHFERALDRFREIGDRPAEALTTGNLGNVLGDLGLLDAAEEHQRRLLALAEETGDRLAWTFGTWSLGNVHAARGRLGEARACHERTLEMAREIGERWGEAEAHIALARLARTENDAEALARHAAQAESIGRAVGLPEVIVVASALAAQLPGADVAAAKAALAEHGPRAGIAERAEACLAIGRATGDRALLEEARRLAGSLLQHAPAECVAAMRTHVPLHRDVAGLASA